MRQRSMDMNGIFVITVKYYYLVTFVILSLAAALSVGLSDKIKLQPVQDETFEKAGKQDSGREQQQSPSVENKPLPLIFADDPKEWNWSIGDQPVITGPERSLLRRQTQSNDPNDFQTVVSLNKTTTTSERSVYIYQGDNYSIHCTPNDAPPPDADIRSVKIEWLDILGHDVAKRHQSRVTVDERSNLVLTGAQPEDAGYYVCHMANVLGSAQVIDFYNAVHVNVYRYADFGVAMTFFFTVNPPCIDELKFKKVDEMNQVLCPKANQVNEPCVYELVPVCHAEPATMQPMMDAIDSQEKATDQSVYKFNRTAFLASSYQLLLICPAGFQLYKKRCSACFAGTYSAKRGDNYCIPCDANTYQDTAATKSCLQCPSGKVTIGKGSTSTNNCQESTQVMHWTTQAIAAILFVMIVIVLLVGICMAARRRHHLSSKDEWFRKLMHRRKKSRRSKTGEKTLSESTASSLVGRRVQKKIIDQRKIKHWDRVQQWDVLSAHPSEHTLEVIERPSEIFRAKSELSSISHELVRNARSKYLSGSPSDHHKQDRALSKHLVSTPSRKNLGTAKSSKLISPDLATDTTVQHHGLIETAEKDKNQHHNQKDILQSAYVETEASNRYNSAAHGVIADGAKESTSRDMDPEEIDRQLYKQHLLQLHRMHMDNVEQLADARNRVLEHINDQISHHVSLNEAAKRRLETANITDFDREHHMKQAELQRQMNINHLRHTQTRYKQSYDNQIQDHQVVAEKIQNALQNLDDEKTENVEQMAFVEDAMAAPSVTLLQHPATGNQQVIIDSPQKD